MLTDRVEANSHGPEQFICYHSEPLRAMFNGEFEEGQTQTLTLEYLNVEVFELFLQWLYTQHLEPRTTYPTRSSDST